MAWFLRAVEVPDGIWACRWGEKEFDRHPELEDALEHLRDIAATLGPTRLFVHPRDGSVRSLGPPADHD